MSQPITDFLAWVDSLLPKDKAKMFKQLFRYPISTNEVTGICYDKLSRIFDGRNPAFNYQFMTSEQREDWEYYRQDVLFEPTVWSQKGWEYLKSEHNSVLIIDMPTIQDDIDKYPQPYFYWLTIDKVISYEVDCKTGNMEWIIFRQEKNIVVIDDESYRIFTEKDCGQIGDLILENPHDLGYCPARFFWNEALNLSEPDIKSHPLSKMLSTLDWFLFFSISKKILDMYGSYPIYSGYEMECNYHNDESGDECDGGYLKDKKGNYKIDASGTLQRCPKCGEKRIIGVGSFVEVPIPHGEDQPDLRDPVQMLGVDASSLKFNVEEQTRLKNEIITSVCGIESEVIKTTAVNEKQVDANYESQSTILNRIKKGFEDAQNFVDSTICKLRYGKLFISSKINLGTDFYTISPEVLRNQYKVAKDAGTSESDLDNLQNQIIETEFRNNQTELQRMFILADLEPYRNLTRDEVLNLFNSKIITENELIIKLNFPTFVRKFERENTNILEFGDKIPYSKKIEVITNKFNDYADQRREGR